MKKILVATFVFVAISMTSPVHAQLLSTSNAPIGTDASKITNDPVQDWSFYTDNENHILYIDFEKINVNLSSLSLRDAANKVVFRDEALWQLPVNTIYEVDFSNKPKGDYVVELRTFTTVLKKTLWLFMQKAPTGSKLKKMFLKAMAGP